MYFQQMLLKHLSRTVIYQSQALFLLLKTTVHNNQSFRKYESEFLNLHSDISMKKYNRDRNKPKLLSAEVKKSRVILWIVLPLLAKALYEFGFFEGIL